MRYAATFFIGFVLGALTLLLALQSRGRLRESAAVVYTTVPDAQPPTTTLIIEPPREAQQRPPLPREPEGVPEPTSSPAASTSSDTTVVVTPPQAGQPRISDDALIAIPVVGVKKNQLRDHFNDRRGGVRTHEAIDIMAARGTPVVASVDGKIRKLFLSDAGGITIYQEDPTGTLIYYYAHLESYSSGLAEGQAVRRGQVIGFVGSTGNANPSGPHLHFAIARLPPTKEWWKGEPINPYAMLMQRGMETIAVKQDRSIQK